MATSISNPDSPLYNTGTLNIKFLNRFEEFLIQENLTIEDSIEEI